MVVSPTKTGSAYTKIHTIVTYQTYKVHQKPVVACVLYPLALDGGRPGEAWGVGGFRGGRGGRKGRKGRGVGGRGAYVDPPGCAAQKLQKPHRHPIINLSSGQSSYVLVGTPSVIGLFQVFWAGGLRFFLSGSLLTGFSSLAFLALDTGGCCNNLSTHARESDQTFSFTYQYFFIIFLPTSASIVRFVHHRPILQNESFQFLLFPFSSSFLLGLLFFPLDDDNNLKNYFA